MRLRESPQVQIAVDGEVAHGDHSGCSHRLSVRFEELAEREDFELIRDMIDEQACYRFNPNPAALEWVS